MSNAPTSWTNIADSLFLAGVKIFDSSWFSMLKNLRYAQELLMHLPAGATQQNYGHGHGELRQDGTPPDGVTLRRTIFAHAFASDGTDYRRHSIGAAWSPIARWRCCNGAVRRLACEVRSEVDTGNVKYRLERWDWVDSGTCTDDGAGTPGSADGGTQYVEESSTVTPATPTWHTIDGDSFTSNGAGGFTANNGGADTKLLYLDGPTSFADFDEMCNRAEYILYAYASTTQDHDLYNVHLFEVLSTDEDGTSDAWLDA